MHRNKKKILDKNTTAFCLQRAVVSGYNEKKRFFILPAKNAVAGMKKCFFLFLKQVTAY
ncbi:MAG: hypothetical protein IJY91_06785 [Oscillospiraceae bacterium]|nr:hypothetical protein [Oscillospiraceae bacterium]